MKAFSLGNNNSCCRDVLRCIALYNKPKMVNAPEMLNQVFLGRLNDFIEKTAFCQSNDHGQASAVLSFVSVRLHMRIGMCRCTSQTAANFTMRTDQHCHLHESQQG